MQVGNPDRPNRRTDRSDIVRRVYGLIKGHVQAKFAVVDQGREGPAAWSFSRSSRTLSLRRSFAKGSFGAGMSSAGPAAERASRAAIRVISDWFCSLSLCSSSGAAARGPSRTAARGEAGGRRLGEADDDPERDRRDEARERPAEPERDEREDRSVRDERDDREGDPEAPEREPDPRLGDRRRRDGSG
ncbi:hypothetical protein PAPYR_12446 [Paratrimastix pyriformis]|uniref:Uncharacterized protein n=1 Tax=Paratrimastix pyriformis TaxID=342808 RepID=A0ABQ8U1W1_9EUKA|nr:hypothetical protein PAPYR_12446 [Paratrimastix pyriformis]